jgi:dihydrofolate reductase
MSRIVVSEFVSLDGVMEDPGGAEGFRHGGWTLKFPDHKGMDYKLKEVMKHEALLLGRLTYEGFAAGWPGRTDTVGFADRMNSMPKYVVSTRLQIAAWNNSTVISGDISEEIPKLRRQHEGDILVVGSRTLVNSLLALGLVDEYRLMVFPIVLGSGKRLFGEHLGPTTLTLDDSKALPSGTLILTYHVTPELR